MSEMSLLTFMAIGAALPASGFGLGWWLRARVHDQIEEEKHTVAQAVQQATVVRVMKSSAGLN